jgi:hypothetical protein
MTIAEGGLDWMDGKPEAELPHGMEEDDLDGDMWKQRKTRGLHHHKLPMWKAGLKV